MLENSYDASGIKFGIIMSTQIRYNKDLESEDEEVRKKAYSKLLYSRTFNIIDFSNVDGLTLDEVLNLSDKQQEDTVLFIIYSNVKYDMTCGIEVNDISNTEFISIKRDDKNHDKQLDDVIISKMLEEYSTKDESYKRKVRCFLQRYKYETKSKTDEIIKEKVIDRK